MYIEPNSTIKILKDVPLDTTYDHTLFFSNRVSQINYFSSKAKYTLNNQTYQRVKRGYMNIKVRAENLYDCNYLMFQNTAFGNTETALGSIVSSTASIGANSVSYIGTQYSTNSLANARIKFFNHSTIYTVVSNTTSTITFTPSLVEEISLLTPIYDVTATARWFYGFIKSVEYINNEVSQIEFEIDDFQTWFFDYTLDMCYVEREHSETDNIGDNIVEENVDLGKDYIVNSTDYFDMNDMKICALIKRTAQGTQQASGGTQAGQFVNGMYFPLHIVAGYDVQASIVKLDNIDTIFTNYAEDDIINIYQYPSVFDTNAQYQSNRIMGIIPSLVTKQIYRNLSLNGYTPKNRKLYTYPYCCLQVSNNCGQINEYKWELFSNAYVFTVAGVVVPTVEALCFPLDYDGVQQNFDEGISYSNFPIIPWSSDQYSNWWVQNEASFRWSQLSNALNGTLNIAAGVVTGNAGQAVSGGLSIIDKTFSDMAKIEDLQHTPTGVHGMSQNSTMNVSIRKTQFTFYDKTIRAEYAKIIDDYFTRYGYATKRNKIPNRNVRPHWTYTKTIGCTITGSMPADSARKICDIYNAGITFWNNPTEVGNYSLDNSPVINPM